MGTGYTTATTGRRGACHNSHVCKRLCMSANKSSSSVMRCVVAYTAVGGRASHHIAYIQFIQMKRTFVKLESDNPAEFIASGRYSAASSPVHHG